MNVKLGTYHEVDARELVTELRSINVRAEMKESAEVMLNEFSFFRGRLSELKEKFSKDFNDIVGKWEKYISTARDILSEGEMTVKDFKNAFLDVFVPERVNTPSIQELFQKKFESEDEVLDELPKEEMDSFKDSFAVKIKELMHEYPLMEILEELGVEDDDDVISENLPEDPTINVPFPDIDEDMAEEFGLDMSLYISISSKYDVFANPVDGFFEREKLDSLVEDYDDIFRLLVVSDIVGKILEFIEENKKIEEEELIEECLHFAKDDEIDVTLARDVVKGILKMLEKEKIIKSKKGKIMLTK